MAFRFVSPAASGNIQYLLSRSIDDPNTITLNDTPSNGETGLDINETLTGSLQSLPFDGVDDYIILPTDSGRGTEFLLDEIGNNTIKHGSTANNIMFETWLKLEGSGTGSTTQFWEATIQRNSTSSTTGFDGIYSSQIVYGTSGGASGNFIEFLFASGSDMAWSLTSADSIIQDTWYHVLTSYTSGDDGSTSKMQIWIDGVLNREQTLNELTGLALGGETDPHPATGAPLAIRQISFGGKLDEMRLWINSGTTESINALASVTSLGVTPEDLATEGVTQFSPSAEYLVAWYRFESISAVDIFAGIADSVVDTTTYVNHGTPVNFSGSVDFSEDQSIVYGPSVTSDLLALKGGTLDHGGMAAFDNLDGTLLFEEGIHNIIVDASNTWVASGSSNVNIDTQQIWVGASGYRVNTTAAGQGAKHTINYSGNLLFDKNTYTCGLRLLSTSGSTSARVVFTIGHSTNSASTTAVMGTSIWKPIFITNTVSADANETTITGSITVQQLHNGGSDNGALFNLDALYLKEGDFPSQYIRPERLRKSGQIFWDIGD